MSRGARRPTHIIKVMDRETKSKKSTVGAAWLNDDGSISITLNAGVSLRWDDGLMITAFDANYQPKDGDS